MRSLTKQKRKKFPKGALLLFMTFIIILQIIDINTINVHAASGVSADGINMNVSADENHGYHKVNFYCSDWCADTRDYGATLSSNKLLYTGGSIKFTWLVNGCNHFHTNAVITATNLNTGATVTLLNVTT